jgi:hypothetical protein
MKKLILAISVALATAAWSTPPESFEPNYVEWTPRLDDVNDSIRAVIDSLAARVDREKEFHSPTAVRQIPVLRYLNDNLPKALDDIIETEKTGDYYDPDLNFVLSCMAGDPYLPYMKGKECVNICGTEKFYAWPDSDDHVRGAVKRQGHTFLVTSLNDALFEKLFMTDGTTMSIEFQNDFYEKLRSNEVLTDEPTANADKHRWAWDIIYEDGRMNILSETHAFDYYNRQNGQNRQNK